MKEVLQCFLLTLLLGALVAPSSVEGAEFTPGLNYAFHLANRYWSDAPEGCVSIDTEIVADHSLPEGREAEASVPAPGEHIACILYIERRFAAPRNFAYTCTLLVHETGHLRGLEHSAEPGNVMHPELRFVPNICLRGDLHVLNLIRYHSRTFNDR